MYKVGCNSISISPTQNIFILLQAKQNNCFEPLHAQIRFCWLAQNRSKTGEYDQQFWLLNTIDPHSVFLTASGVIWWCPTNLCSNPCSCILMQAVCISSGHGQQLDLKKNLTNPEHALQALRVRSADYHCPFTRVSGQPVQCDCR